jgi:hypothetical protein
MKTIENCKSLVKKLRNGEHFDFHEVIVEFVKSHVSLIAPIIILWNAFLQAFEKEDIVYKHSSKLSETKLIRDLERRRKNAFLELKRGIESASYSDDIDKKAASIKLGEVLENYKKITTAPITEVTAMVFNMIQDLKSPKYGDAVAELYLTAVVTSLEDKNDELKALYVERAQSLSEYEHTGGMKDVRIVVDKAFQNFITVVNSLYVTVRLKGVPDNENPYAAIIDFINGYIEQYERIYERRTPGYTSPEGEKPSEGDEDPDIPVIIIPKLAVSEQTIEDNKTMLLIMDDQPAFDSVLYPIAEGGIMSLSADDVNDSYNEFPIKSFKVSGGKPVGLNIAPPDEDLVFNKPMYSMGPCRAEIIKDGELLAVLTGVEWPASYTG